MKIVFFAPFGIRPKGTLIARMLPLAVELQKHGHIVVIVAPPYTNPEDSGKTESVQGVKICNVDLGPRSKALAAPLLAWRMFRATLREKPDLVHLFKPKGYGGLAGMLLVLLRGLGLHLPPLIVDTDDWEGRGGMNNLKKYSFFEKKIFELQEQWLPSKASGVTVASRTLETKIWGLGIRPERVLYLPNSIEQIPKGNGSAVRQTLRIPHESPTVLIYTRFFEFPQEKLHYLLAEIHRRVPNAFFLVVGKGPNKEEELLLRAAEEKGFSSALIFAGWVEPENLPHYLAVGDVALYPFSDTLINRSKCPAKATEILRSEVALVADRVGQLAEYIKPEVSGILCDPDDWQEMVERAVELLGETERRKQLGQEGRRHLLQKFTWQITAARLEQFYKLMN